MDKNEYDEFVDYLYQEYIEDRFARVRSRISRGKFDDELQNRVEELARALRAIRLIMKYADDDETIRRSFTLELFDNIFSDVEDGVRFRNAIAVDSGIVDVIDEYFEELVTGMKADHFLKEDFDVLRFAGSSDPHREISAMIHIVKSRKERIRRQGENIRFSERLTHSVENIEKLRGQVASRNEPNRKSNIARRAIFKGLGSITQGTLLTIVDITLAAGVWTVTLPSETTTVGALVSATTGVG